MNQKVIEIEKVAAIIEEVEASYQFITGGIEQLKKGTSPVLSNHVTLQLLASGFERLVKILLFLKEKYDTGDFPRQTSGNFFSKYGNGHDIAPMVRILVDCSDQFELMNISPLVRSEMDFLNNDPECKELIEILSDFGKWERYFYIDVIAKDNRAESNCFEKFRSLIYGYCIPGQTDKLSVKDEEQYIKKQTVALIERTIRALVRFFTHAFDGTAQQYYGSFNKFISLNDADLGEAKYLIPVADNKKPIDINSLLGIEIRLKSKSRRVDSSDVNEWPFTTESVVVRSINDASHCFVEIEGQIFGLNSLATSVYKVPLYFDSPYLIPRASCVELMQFAKELR